VTVPSPRYSPLVLILTHPEDVHADAVQGYLSRIGVPYHRMDTAKLGTSSAPANVLIKRGRIKGLLGGCDLSRVTCVWHRRPSTMSGDPIDVAELRIGVGGVLAGLPYLNHPARMAAALKPFQLVAAGACGLHVPDTLISSQPEVAKGFSTHGPVVVKPMSREVHGLIKADDTSGWSRAIHMTQQRIDAAHHVRLTVVDDDMFAARIDTPHLDWRESDKDAKYSVIESPAYVRSGVRQLMHRLVLRYGALDFAVDEQGHWWFLEVNPNGQWLWIEDATGLPICAAVAKALAARHNAHRPFGHGWDSLTPMEFNVAQLVGEGLSNPQIAKRLVLSTSTIKTHMRHIMAKLDVDSRVEVTMKIRELGALPVNHGRRILGSGPPAARVTT
jgi:DNA-binding CsgD family transcriptional regulator